jgi:hypothetical protein
MLLSLNEEKGTSLNSSNSQASFLFLEYFLQTYMTSMPFWLILFRREPVKLRGRNTLPEVPRTFLCRIKSPKVSYTFETLMSGHHRIKSLVLDPWALKGRLWESLQGTISRAMVALKKMDMSSFWTFGECSENIN